MSRAFYRRKFLPTFFAILMFAHLPLVAQTFVRVTEASNPIAVDLGDQSYNGSSWVDYDSDGKLDLFVNRGKLYHNEGNGVFTRIVNHGIGAGLLQGLGSGNSWADIDNDGDLDCFYSGARSKLYCNEGNGVFTAINVGDIGSSVDTRGWSSAWADYDNDGFVDLVITHPAAFVGTPTTNHLFRNEGGARFTRVTNSDVVTGLAPYTVATWADYDDDGDQDLFIGSGPAGSVAPDYLYKNLLKESGTATLQRITSGAWATELRDGQNYNWIDYDNDGDLDMYLTNYAGTTGGMANHMYRNDNGAFTKITTGAIVTDREVSLGNIWADFDNDGDLDCLVTNEGGAPNRYYTNNGNGTFTRVTTLPFLTKPAASNNAGATAGDYDNDGDLDLFLVGQSTAAALYRNELNTGAKWLSISCEGTVSNRSAIGLSVRAKATINGQSVWQRREISAQNGFNSHNSLRVHFGLGNAAQVDSLIFIWPSGAREVQTNVATNQILHVVESFTSAIPRANFSSEVLEGAPPLVVKFRDLSLPAAGAPITEWAWDFDGDGVTDSREQNPTWTYTRVGKYLVLLRVKSNGNTGIIARNEFIHVLQFGKASAATIGSEVSAAQGGSWADADADGDLDLFVANASNQNEFFYVNNGNGTFTKNTTSAIATDGGSTLNASWGDYDRDGDLDLYLANFNQANTLFENNGNGSFTKITTGAIVTDRELSSGSSWIDVDNDGDLDIFATNFGPNESLYRNNGDRTFTKETTGGLVNDRGFTQSASWADFDNDGDMDVFLANDRNENNALFANNGDGTFTKVTNSPVVSDGGNSFGGSWGDYDNDGDFDLFVTNAGTQSDFFYRNEGNGAFTKITEGPHVTEGAASQASGWSDFDNDGDLDLFVTTVDRESFMYANNGDGSFTKLLDNPFRSEVQNATSASWGDYDNDGDSDLFVTVNGGSSVLYVNAGNGNHSVKIKCVGVMSNTTAIGAKVRVKATINGKSVWQVRQIAQQSGFNSHNSLLAEFGLGDATQVDSIKVEWPSKKVDVLVKVAAGSYVITEGSTTAVANETGELPLRFALHQNYPNPFNPTTTIAYALARPGKVSLRIFNLLGEEVAQLVQRTQPAGVYRVQWNGKDARGVTLSSGVYLYKLETEVFTETKRLLLVK